MEAGFDNSLYIHKQTEHIRQRIAQWGGKLYLEFGGKLFDDYHAARVLPGFDPNGKIRLLYEMREQAEIDHPPLPLVSLPHCALVSVYPIRVQKGSGGM